MYLLFVFFVFCMRVDGIPKDSSGSEDVTGLVTSLRNDANLDLSEDEEYEDLRAEFLAYHSALSSLASSRQRGANGQEAHLMLSDIAAHGHSQCQWARECVGGLLRIGSLISTPCWSQGGICINYKLCPRHLHLTEIPGCKNRLNVCCFVWNQYEVRDMRDQGIHNIAFPWSPKHDYGGEGIITVTKKKLKKKRKPTTETAIVFTL